MRDGIGGKFAALCAALYIVLLAAPAHVSATEVETVLYSFTEVGAFDSNPWGLVADNQGNLYGATTGPTNGNGGGVFEVSPAGGSISWLHTFSGPDGAEPLGGMVFDNNGNLYGTAAAGGSGGHLPLQHASRLRRGLQAFAAGLRCDFLVPDNYLPLPRRSGRDGPRWPDRRQARAISLGLPDLAAAVPARFLSFRRRTAIRRSRLPGARGCFTPSKAERMELPARAWSLTAMATCMA